MTFTVRTGQAPTVNEAAKAERFSFGQLKLSRNGLLGTLLPDRRLSLPNRVMSELPVIRYLGHWRRVHARLGQALEIVLVHRLHFGGRGPHATELREFLEARFSQSF